jgi:Yip1 domain
MADTSTMSIATNIFTSPGEAFAAIKERPSPWFPLLILVGAYCAVSVLYLYRVDLAWMIDSQLAASGNLTEEQRTQAVDAALRLPRGVYVAFGVLSALIVYPLLFAIFALYYTGASFFTNTGVKFKQWFALLAWCCLPFLLGLLATLVYIVSGDVRFVGQEGLNPLSFGNLLGIDSAGAPTVQRVLLALDPTVIWTVVLTVFGYQALSQRSILHAATVVLAPYALIVLVAAALANL